MKWFFRIIGLIFLVFAGLVIWGYFISPNLSVERSLQVDAYPEEVFEYLEDLEAFNRWSPWFARDPDADYVFGAVEYGVGASAVWRTRGTTAESAAEISSQEIIAAQAPEFVQSARPFHYRRHAGQYRFYIAASFKPKCCAAIMKQVELNIASALNELSFAVGLSPRF